MNQFHQPLGHWGLGIIRKAKEQLRAVRHLVLRAERVRVALSFDVL